MEENAKTLDDIFKSKMYDSTLWEKVIKHYESGGFCSVNDQGFETLDELGEFVWDFFSDFVDKNANNLIWPAFGLKHRNPYRNEQMYYDGLILGLCHEEFMECLKHENRSVSRFFSLLMHFSYGFKFEYKIKE